MTPNPPPASETPRPSPGSNARSVVEEVLRDQAERAQRRDQGTRPPKDRGPTLWGVAVVLAAATLWALRAPPSFLQPPPPPQPPPAVREAGLRMSVYVATLKVDAFRERTGHLPDALAQVFEGPEDLEGLVYERLGPDRYRLTGSRGEDVVIYESGDDVRALVGGARQVLEQSR